MLHGRKHSGVLVYECLSFIWSDERNSIAGFIIGRISRFWTAISKTLPTAPGTVPSHRGRHGCRDPGCLHSHTGASCFPSPQVQPYRKGTWEIMAILLRAARIRLHSSHNYSFSQRRSFHGSKRDKMGLCHSLRDGGPESCTYVDANASLVTTPTHTMPDDGIGVRRLLEPLQTLNQSGPSWKEGPINRKTLNRS